MTQLRDTSTVGELSGSHILNLQPAHAPEPHANEPYHLTFYVENDTSAKQLQQTDYSDDPDDHQVVVESFESPQSYSDKAPLYHGAHDRVCILSAFLYFVTVSTIVYLAVLWLKQRVNTQIEQLYWW